MTGETSESLALWARRLRAHAARVFEPLQRRRQEDPERFLAEFRDEQGQRRAVDPPLLRHVFGLDERIKDDAGMTGDVALWHSVAGRAWHDALITPSGVPLLTHGPKTSVEVWTEAELSGMHALWSAGRVHKRPELQARALEAALWHLERTQPDNATNHAWGVHVFVIAGLRHDVPEAGMLAETLVHNCTVNLGKPDVLSAVLLMHAAMELEREAECTEARGHGGTAA